MRRDSNHGITRDVEELMVPHLMVYLGVEERVITWFERLNVIENRIRPLRTSKQERSEIADTTTRRKTWPSVREGELRRKGRGRGVGEGRRG